MPRGRIGRTAPRAPGAAWARPLLPPQAWLGLTLLLVGLAACGSTPKPRAIEPDVDLHHPDPGRRALAVQQVAADGDTTRVPDLIELLDDRDESVRLVASGALSDLTGREGAYQAFAPRAERLAAIEDWRAWYAAEQPGGEGAR